MAAARSLGDTRRMSGRQLLGQSVERHHPGGRHRGGLRTDASQDDRPFAVPGGVEPVGDARILMGHHHPHLPVIVHDGLEAVEAGLMVAVVDRLPPDVPQRVAPVQALRRRDLDDQRLVGRQLPRTDDRTVLGRRPHGRSVQGREEGVGCLGIGEPQEEVQVLLHEVAQGDDLTGHGRLRLLRCVLFEAGGTRKRLDGHGDGNLVLPVVEEVPDHQHGGALVEGEPVALVGLGREDDLELPVGTQLELVDQGVGRGSHPRHDLQSHVPGRTPVAPQAVGGPALQGRADVDAVRALHAPLVGGVHARGLHRRHPVQPPSQKLVDTHPQQDEQVAEAGGHVHRVVGDRVGEHDVAGCSERVQQVVPRLTGVEILAGGIAGGGRLAHREGEPSRILERTHD